MALEEFLRGFREGTYPEPRWKHREHVIMAVCYLLDHSVDAATPLIREGIQSYNLAQGGQNTAAKGYHETLTIFWIRIVDRFLAGLPGGTPRLAAARLAVDTFAPQRDLYKQYWSFDVLRSTEARFQWIPPDLKTFDGLKALPPIASLREDEFQLRTADGATSGYSCRCYRDPKASS